MGKSSDEALFLAARAAHRVLHHMVVDGGQARDLEADVQAAGPAMFGVLNAFLRNVMEYVFNGSEPVEHIHAYLVQLQQAHPSELKALQPQPMAVFVKEQIGPGAPPPGQSRFQVNDGVVHQSRLIAEYTAKHEGFSRDQVELYLQGATARYVTGGF
ncbi:hypothetical protein ACIHEI_05960 [Kitasatospora sp. NPDC051984]|uniref:hypothetical protein n=1 Tax=Kitasatospora sp. NPDC051984 TaxID=3364059 RepID=UPI0037CAA32B